MKSNRNHTIVRLMLKYCKRIEDLCNEYNLIIEMVKSKYIYQSSLTFSLQQIGELVTHLTKDFRLAHPQIPWTGIIKTRNIAAHEYEKFNFDYL